LQNQKVFIKRFILLKRLIKIKNVLYERKKTLKRKIEEKHKEYMKKDIFNLYKLWMEIPYGMGGVATPTILEDSECERANEKTSQRL